MKRSLIHKIQSFTLLEVIVVLLLSTFFIGMVYYSMIIYLSIIQKNKTTILENVMISSLYSSLTAESSISDYMEADLFDSVIFCVMPSEDTIKYELHTSRIIRYQSCRIDTFFIPLLSVSFSFNGKQVQKGYVDWVSIKVGREKKSMELAISKYYTPGVLFNRINHELTKPLK